MKHTLLFIFLIVVLSSCSEKECSTSFTPESYSIVLGHICGWCAGADSLHITKDLVEYTTIDYCRDTVSTQQQKTSSYTWDYLMEKLQIEEFLRIDLNTCYVCADGCDTWITVSNDTLYHSIRFGYSDSLAIQPIQAFIDALHEIQSDFISR